MNQRRQDILRAYHQMVLAQVPEAHIRLAFEEGDLENLQEDVASTKSGSISSIELHVQETRAEREDRVRVGIASRVVAHRDQVEGALFDVADRAGASSLVGARQGAQRGTRRRRRLTCPSADRPCPLPRIVSFQRFRIWKRPLFASFVNEIAVADESTSVMAGREPVGRRS